MKIWLIKVKSNISKTIDVLKMVLIIFIISILVYIGALDLHSNIKIFLMR